MMLMATHGDELLGFGAVVHHVQLGAAAPLVVADVDGQLGGLQPLIAVTLTPTPLVDVLKEGDSS